mmetsp:Transcript_36036/g.111043  ORF Transcript_36036/g.111043 Transcript_36036/m.111043 type:complete len:273 (+) Transcript_36036:844-1662(+)
MPRRPAGALTGPRSAGACGGPPTWYRDSPAAPAPRRAPSKEAMGTTLPVCPSMVKLVPGLNSSSCRATRSCVARTSARRRCSALAASRYSCSSSDIVAGGGVADLAPPSPPAALEPAAPLPAPLPAAFPLLALVPFLLPLAPAAAPEPPFDVKVDAPMALAAGLPPLIVADSVDAAGLPPGRLLVPAAGARREWTCDCDATAAAVFASISACVSGFWRGSATETAARAHGSTVTRGARGSTCQCASVTWPSSRPTKAQRTKSSASLTTQRTV